MTPKDLAARIEALDGPDREIDADEQWFCDKGDFWGTINQLLLCAKCGKNEHKRYNEPSHRFFAFQPNFQMLCDECYDTLPEADDLAEQEAK